MLKNAGNVNNVNNVNIYWVEGPDPQKILTLLT